MTLLTWYLWFGVVFAALFFLNGIIEDLRGTWDHKFGGNLLDMRGKYVYNPKTYVSSHEKGPHFTFNGLFWAMSIMHAIPVLNLFFIWLWTEVYFHERKLDKHRKTIG